MQLLRIARSNQPEVICRIDILSNLNRNLFRINSNIYDGDFCNRLTIFAVNYFCKNAPS